MDDTNQIFLYQPQKNKVDTRLIFDIIREDDKLRVKNKNVNCLFSNLTPETFQATYNNFYQHLNLNFSPVIIHGQVYQTSPDEQICLEQAIITNCIYVYTINNQSPKVTPSDFAHPFIVDHLLVLLDKKFGTDTEISLTIGASILRQKVINYYNTVLGRRRFYNR